MVCIPHGIKNYGGSLTTSFISAPCLSLGIDIILWAKEVMWCIICLVVELFKLWGLFFCRVLQRIEYLHSGWLVELGILSKL